MFKAVPLLTAAASNSLCGAMFRSPRTLDMCQIHNVIWRSDGVQSHNHKFERLH